MPTQAVTHREVCRLAWPMIVSNCSIPLLGIVDTALLGHLESALFLGAVAVGSTILSFILWAFGFLRMGTTSVIAQAHGRGDHAGCAQMLLQSVLFAVAVAVSLIVFSPLLFKFALWLMAPEADVTELAGRYCLIRIASAPATLITYVLIGWFIGMQRTREPLLIMVFTNSANIGLDWLLIVVLGMNSNGAALATVMAEYSGLLLGGWLVLRMLPVKPQRINLRQWLSDSRTLIQIHGHLFIRTLCLLFAFAFFTAQGARQGETVLAANAILLQLLALVSYGLDGFAHAAEALVGKAVGARNASNLRLASRYSAQWSGATALLCTLVFIAAQPLLINLFTDIETVRMTVRQFFPWLVALPLVSFVSYWLDGVFIGAGKTRAMRNTIILSCFLFYLPIWWLFQGLGNHGLWAALLGFNGARGLIMTYYWLSFKLDEELREG